MNDTSKSNNDNIPVIDHVDSFQELIKKPTVIGTLEFLTGLAVMSIERPTSLILSGGRLVQSLLKHKFYQQLYDEVIDRQQAGKIQEEMLETTKAQTLLRDLLLTIDEDNLDEVKYEALKNIFLKSIESDSDEYKQVVAYQYLQVCKKLSSLDILVLREGYDIYRKNKVPSLGASGWDQLVAEGLGFPVELVTESRDINTVKQSQSKSSLYEIESHARRGMLSNLGIEVSKFIIS